MQAAVDGINLPVKLAHSNLKEIGVSTLKQGCEYISYIHQKTLSIKLFINILQTKVKKTQLRIPYNSVFYPR